MNESAAARHDDLQPRVDTRCVVCGSDDTRMVASATELEAQRRYLRLFHRRRLRIRRGEEDAALEERADFTQGYATNVVACCECGLLYRDPRPCDDAIAAAYEGDTYGAERLEALFESQLELFRPKARLLAKWLDRPQPVVLEIGSFVGGFLAACAEQGWDAMGIDPGREVAEFCERRGLVVLRENADDCEFPRVTADCVAIWNTFDQLPDPHPTLRSVARCLRPGGLLALRVPDGLCFDRCMQVVQRWPRPLRRVLLAAMAWNNLLFFPYLRGYSLETLDRLLASYGFERVHAHGDVLTRLSDEHTKTWARWEERLLKAAWTFLAKVGGAPGQQRSATSPWLDVYYTRRAGSGIQSAQLSGVEDALAGDRERGGAQRGAMLLGLVPDLA